MTASGPTAEIAMAFCRNVLKWRKPEYSGTDRDEFMWVNAPGGTRFLRFDDLNAVKETVRQWCDLTGRTLSILPPAPDQPCWKVSLSKGKFTGVSINHDLCRALMLACLSASLLDGDRIGRAP